MKVYDEYAPNNLFLTSNGVLYSDIKGPNNMTDAEFCRWSENLISRLVDELGRKWSALTVDAMLYVVNQVKGLDDPFELAKNVVESSYNCVSRLCLHDQLDFSVLTTLELEDYKDEETQAPLARIRTRFDKAKLSDLDWHELSYAVRLYARAVCELGEYAERSDTPFVFADPYVDFARKALEDALVKKVFSNDDESSDVTLFCDVVLQRATDLYIDDLG